MQVEYLEAGALKSESLSLVEEQQKLRLNHIIANHKVETMHTQEASLEEIFIKITGKELK